MLKYKIDVIRELSEKGFNTTRIRREKLISEQTLQAIRENRSITLTSLNVICCLLRKTPDEILKFEMTDEEKIKYFY